MVAIKDSSYPRKPNEASVALIKAFLFDLGNTLVSYYSRDEFPMVLAECIGRCTQLLLGKGVSFRDDGLWGRVKDQYHEPPDDRVRPLEDRLGCIFGVDDGETVNALCGAFLEPIFELAVLHGDVKPTLVELRLKGIKTAIVSNTPWGSPAGLWRRELDRLGLVGLVDAAVFCRDVGWRKPDGRVFLRALGLLGVGACDAVFVGDDPRWDVEGARRLGMRCVLVNRSGGGPGALCGLGGLLGLL